MSRIAIVHDYFTQQGGAERVAEEFSQMFPQSEMFTTVALDKKVPPGIAANKLRTSWMQKLPGIETFYRFYFPLYPLGVRALDLSAYDLVISSSSGYGKGVRTRTNALHVCYCHTPMRWVWRYRDYAKREDFSFAKRLALPMLIEGLRAWDRDAARQPDQYVANSQVVAERIRECYGREAVVIPPPIDINRFGIGKEQDDYYLVLSRLVPYKRIDLAIEACNRLGRRLMIVGDGSDQKKLKQIAGKTITFLGRLSDAETSRYASACRALLFPGEEDFGMVPLEVAAAGRPTIAFQAGGATETVVDGKTGVFFEKQKADSLAEAILASESISWDPQALREHAAGFDIATFRKRFYHLLEGLGMNIDALTLQNVQPITSGQLGDTTHPVEPRPRAAKSAVA